MAVDVSYVCPSPSSRLAKDRKLFLLPAAEKYLEHLENASKLLTVDKAARSIEDYAAVSLKNYVSARSVYAMFSFRSDIGAVSLAMCHN